MYDLRDLNAYLLSKGYRYIGYGRTRKVYISPRGGWVIKLPRNDYGERINIAEVENYNKGRKISGEGPLARCKLIYLEGLACVIMEALTNTRSPEDEYDDHLPDWTMYTDCQQVGYTRKGVLVAYDYGESFA